MDSSVFWTPYSLWSKYVYACLTRARLLPYNGVRFGCNQPLAVEITLGSVCTTLAPLGPV
jgi:hypothetical protein